MKALAVLAVIGLLVFGCITNGGTPAGKTPPKSDIILELNLRVINDSIRLCETENPGYDYTAECDRYIEAKHQNRTCTFTLENFETLPFGSCQTCLIVCTEKQ